MPSASRPWPVGAKYPAPFVDASGDFLSGSQSYKLNLPKGVPAALFWSVSVYDSITASGLDNGQPFPSINAMDKPATNADGAIDIYFGPRSPGEGRNWLRTLPGKGFFVILRRYSPKAVLRQDVEVQRHRKTRLAAGEGTAPGESSAKSLADTLRSRGRARPEQPHRRRTRAGTGRSRRSSTAPGGGGETGVRAAAAAAQKLGLATQVLKVRRPEEFGPAFASARKDGAHAVIQIASPFLATHRRRLIELAAAQRFPMTCETKLFVSEGCLMAYGPNFADMSRRAALDVDRILKGVNPADLPVEQPTSLELAINTRTAKSLGLTIPRSLLLRADQVVE